MRAIQAGILICLAAITGLLFAIYQRQAPPPAVVEAHSEEVTPHVSSSLHALEAAPAPPAAPAPIVPASKPKPVPARSSAAPAPKPAPSAKPLKTAPVIPLAEEPLPEPQPVPPTPELPEISAAEPAEAVESSEVAAATEPLQEEIPAEPEPREPRVVTLEAGQKLTVRLDNTLSTSRSRVDDTFFATLDEPVIVDGLIIAAKGARLEGRVIESQPAGRVKGLARLACELTYLHTDDGQRVGIASSTFALDGPGSRNEDLKKVAMGAGAGAILGAIFGGGKGAAIGAASGAGAGVGAAAATRGEPAVIEPETRLDFRLAEDISITEKL